MDLPQGLRGGDGGPPRGGLLEGSRVLKKNDCSCSEGILRLKSFTSIYCLVNGHRCVSLLLYLAWVRRADKLVNENAKNDNRKP